MSNVPITLSLLNETLSLLRKIGNECIVYGGEVSDNNVQMLQEDSPAKTLALSVFSEHTVSPVELLLLPESVTDSNIDETLLLHRNKLLDPLLSLVSSKSLSLNNAKLPEKTLYEWRLSNPLKDTGDIPELGGAGGYYIAYNRNSFYYHSDGVTKKLEFTADEGYQYNPWINYLIKDLTERYVIMSNDIPIHSNSTLEIIKLEFPYTLPLFNIKAIKRMYSTLHCSNDLPIEEVLSKHWRPKYVDEKITVQMGRDLYRTVHKARVGALIRLERPLSKVHDESIAFHIATDSHYAKLETPVTYNHVRLNIEMANGLLRTLLGRTHLAPISKRD